VLLVVSRLVQGAGSALVAPAALSLITTGFAQGPRRNRALGMYGATASVGFVAGQVLGGVLVQFTSWRAVFLVNVPVGLLAAVMLVGFGTAGTAFGTMVTASHGVANGDQGVVGGVINTSRQIGAAMGAALLPAVAEAVDHGNRAGGAGGDRAAMLAGAVAAALALAVALGGVKRTRPRLSQI
jgi:Major Facilitator Superfamily